LTAAMVALPRPQADNATADRGVVVSSEQKFTQARTTLVRAVRQFSEVLASEE
jgi:hypothetical protein